MLDYILLILTAAIPLVPIGTRKWNIQNGRRGIDKLKFDNKPDIPASVYVREPIEPADEPDLTKLPEDTLKNTLSRNEYGFDQITTAIKEHRRIDSEIKNIHHFCGNVWDISKSLGIGFPYRQGLSYSGILCVEFTDGTYDLVLHQPHDHTRMLELTEVDTWVKEIATIRSNQITTTLAFVWFAVALLAGRTGV